MLQRFAVLAYQLGFSSPEIQKLKGDADPLLIPDAQESDPLLVTTGPGVSKKQRCGLPHTDNFEVDRKYLSLYNLCEERDETGEGITSFFVLKSWFHAFFDPPRLKRPVLNTEGTNPPPASDCPRHVDEMQDVQPETSKQLERVQDDKYEQVQQTTRQVQTSELGRESPYTPMEEDTLFGSSLIRNVFTSLI